MLATLTLLTYMLCILLLVLRRFFILFLDNIIFASHEERASRERQKLTYTPMLEDRFLRYRGCCR